MRADADKLQATLDADAKKLADLNELARRECNGTSGPGLTGGSARVRTANGCAARPTPTPGRISSDRTRRA